MERIGLYCAQYMQYSWCLTYLSAPVCSRKCYFRKLVILFLIGALQMNPLSLEPQSHRSLCSYKGSFHLS